MITTPITRDRIESWKALFARFAPAMLPNRKTGTEVDAYFRSKYAYTVLNSLRLEEVTKENILGNQHACEKIPKGESPFVRCYSVSGVLVGIDLKSGYFHVESADTAKMAAIYDDLFVFRGLDAADMKNYALVGQYLELTQQHNGKTNT